MPSQQKMKDKKHLLKHITLYVVALSMSFTMIFCSKQGSYVVENQGGFSQDSISLKITDSITLNIGDRIVPMPMQSQVMEDNDSLKYYILDENKLYCFDLMNDRLIDTKDVKGCGTLNNYSGFRIHNKDSLFVYNYKKKELYILNRNGGKINAFGFPSNQKNVSPEAINQSPIIISSGLAVLSGIPISKKSRMTANDPISAIYDLSSGKIKFGAHMSDDYSKGYFGGVYFNSIYHCLDSENRLVYSFPASNYIYRYKLNNMELEDSIYMGSRYTKRIESAPEPTLEFLKDENERIKYYVNKDSYSGILYDPYRQLYYRIAEHPSENIDDPFPKPFSIIVMDMHGKIITETPIQTSYGKFNRANMHVIKDGLLIQKKTENENQIKFAIYKFHE